MRLNDKAARATFGPIRPFQRLTFGMLCCIVIVCLVNGTAEGQGSQCVPTYTGVVNVRCEGAIGDGVHDDTQALTTASNKSQLLHVPMFLPSGHYVFRGEGLVGSHLSIRGTGAENTEIQLGAHGYLVDDNRFWQSFELSSLTVRGGDGAIRNRFRGSNVAGNFTIDDCRFLEYKLAAVSHNSTDMPYWSIRRSRFKAIDTVASIGIALSGLTDSSVLEDNQFLSDHIHLKLGRGGNNAHITRCEFIQFSVGYGRTAIWFVPSPGSYRNAGQGMVVRDSKFGAENLGPSDHRILYADEENGPYFGDRLPAERPSAGFIAGQLFQGIYVGTGSSGNEVAYSYTPNISGSAFGPIILSGTPPKILMRFAETLLPLQPNLYNRNNTFGPLQFIDQLQSASYADLLVSNGVDVGKLTDPTGDFASLTEPAPSGLGGDEDSHCSYNAAKPQMREHDTLTLFTNIPAQTGRLEVVRLKARSLQSSAAPLLLTIRDSQRILHQQIVRFENSWTIRRVNFVPRDNGNVSFVASTAGVPLTLCNVGLGE